MESPLSSNVNRTARLHHSFLETRRAAGPDRQRGPGTGSQAVVGAPAARVIVDARPPGLQANCLTRTGRRTKPAAVTRMRQHVQLDGRMDAPLARQRTAANPESHQRPGKPGQRVSRNMRDHNERRVFGDPSGHFNPAKLVAVHRQQLAFPGAVAIAKQHIPAQARLGVAVDGGSVHPVPTDSAFTTVQGAGVQQNGVAAKLDDLLDHSSDKGGTDTRQPAQRADFHLDGNQVARLADQLIEPRLVQERAQVGRKALCSMRCPGSQTVHDGHWQGCPHSSTASAQSCTGSFFICGVRSPASKSLSWGRSSQGTRLNGSASFT